MRVINHRLIWQFHNISCNIYFMEDIKFGGLDVVDAVACHRHSECSTFLGCGRDERATGDEDELRVRYAVHVVSRSSCCASFPDGRTSSERG